MQQQTFLQLPAAFGHYRRLTVGNHLLPIILAFLYLPRQLQVSLSLETLALKSPNKGILISPRNRLKETSQYLVE